MLFKYNVLHFVYMINIIYEQCTKKTSNSTKLKMELLFIDKCIPLRSDKIYSKYDNIIINLSRKSWSTNNDVRDGR